ncbi:MAG: hypothetical protein AMXMBFR74_09420 [Parvibaculum sp.]
MRDARRHLSKRGHLGRLRELALLFAEEKRLPQQKCESVRKIEIFRQEAFRATCRAQEESSVAPQRKGQGREMPAIETKCVLETPTCGRLRVVRSGGTAPLPRRNQIERPLGIPARRTMPWHEEANPAIKTSLHDTGTARANAFADEGDELLHLLARRVLSEEQSKSLKHCFRFPALTFLPETRAPHQNHHGRRFPRVVTRIAAAFRERSDKTGVSQVILASDRRNVETVGRTAIELNAQATNAPPLTEDFRQASPVVRGSH